MTSMYRPLVHLQASVSSKKIHHGDRGCCRYCGTEDGRLFRQAAHLIPEALGNRWLFSVDECDLCNQQFSRYEDALAAALGPLLTLGGVVGKGGRVRQTGRTAGSTVVSHDRVDGKRSLRIIARNDRDYRDRVTHDGEHIFFRTPLPETPFKPLFAYKALVKMALALMPTDELSDYCNMLQLLQNRDSSVASGSATVGLSFGSIGNAPPMVLASMLKRIDDALLIPKFMVIVVVGSVCIQLFLWGDGYLQNGVAYGTPSLVFKAYFPNPGHQDFCIAYDHPHDLDWSSAVPQPQPLKEMVLKFHPGTTEGEFFPDWR